MKSMRNAIGARSQARSEQHSADAKQCLGGLTQSQEKNARARVDRDSAVVHAITQLDNLILPDRESLEKDLGGLSNNFTPA